MALGLSSHEGQRDKKGPLAGCKKGSWRQGGEEEMAGKWHSIRKKREVGSEGGSDELQMLTASVGMSTRRETWPRAESWHAIRPGRDGEL